jgi:hypothetical protein
VKAIKTNKAVPKDPVIDAVPLTGQPGSNAAAALEIASAMQGVGSALARSVELQERKLAEDCKDKLQKMEELTAPVSLNSKAKEELKKKIMQAFLLKFQMLRYSFISEILEI